MDFLKLFKWNMVFIGLASMVMGVFLVISPDTAALTICRAVGAILLIAGVVALFAYFRGKKAGIQTHKDLIIGAIEVGVGIIIIANPWSFTGFIGTVVAVVMFIHGVNDITEGIAVRRMGDKNWTHPVIMGALTLLFGAIILINPFSSLSALMVLIGIGLIFDGATELLVAYRTAKFIHRANDRGGRP